ncbi:hypothetical protein ABXS71_16840 [Bacillus infantis]|uniref:hypothetical protein n=1 Tax=Bacillus infantis TaxID=324767 RepID=UPI00344C70CE
MPTLEAVDQWIQGNVLDRQAWNDSTEKEIAVIQASRNLARWYPGAVITDELVAYQAIWELQGIDPALKFQKQGVKSVSEGSDRIDYAVRDKVASEVQDILGPFVAESLENAPVVLESGRLI